MKIHQLLARQGVRVPYSSLHRFAVQHCGFRDERRVTVRVAEVAAGELAEVDFGRLGWVHDPETGKRRTLHALIVLRGAGRPRPGRLRRPLAAGWVRYQRC